MFQLSIQTEKGLHVATFEKDAITIGSHDSSDLHLPNEPLQETHVKIFELDGRFSIHNVANDPFVTLNSLPFGKSKIHSGDILQIGNTLLRFEAGGQSQPKPLPSSDASDRFHEALEKTIASARKEEVLSDDEIQDLIQEAELLADEEEAPIEALISESDPKKRERSFQDYAVKFPEKNSDQLDPSEANEDSYIYDLEDEVSNFDEEEKDPHAEKPGFFGNWSVLFILLIAVIVVMLIVAVGTYVKISDRSDAEKMTAAEGVADVAMALTFAQIHHIKPQKQNWSDPEFIKNNLTSVLSAEYPTFANLDNQGQFTNCPYILRIYTSSDLSQFLVIAQPEPSVLQWLIPKTSIIVDSRAMEMRNISDLKALNRLLLNASTLDGAHAIDISEIIKQGAIIPLSTLAGERSNAGFAPPKSLALVRPGAENLIYNAPRYYHFGDRILNRADSLLRTLGNSHEVVRLKQEIHEISKFPDLVLYSEQGMEKAIQAQKALWTLAPNNKFLTAYLSFDDKGEILNSYLLPNDSVAASPAAALKDSDAHLAGLDTSLSLAEHNAASLASSAPAFKFDGGIDHNHPLYLQLMALTKSRQHALKAINEKMIALLNNNTEEGISKFPLRFDKLWKEYNAVDKQQREKVTQVLKVLYGEYDIPLAQFAMYVKAAGLEIIAKTSLAKHFKEIGGPRISAEQIQGALEKIQQSANLADLENHVKTASEMLTLTNFPEAVQLIVYQNQMRTLTLERLRNMILSSQGPLEPSSFNESNYTTLTRILQAAWVNDHDEYNYYLHEFELRMQRNP